MRIIQYLVIFIAFNCLVLASNEESQNLPSHLRKQTRQLQSCPSNCDLCDLDGFCLQCSNLRVFPNCSCQLGYYESQGTCKQCKPGCMSCTSDNDCQACFSIYVYNAATTNCDCNIPHVGGCEDQQTGILIYITRLNTDLRSFVVTFNQMITMVGVPLDQQFSGSFQNCQQILDPSTVQVYNNNSPTEQIPNCLIDPLNRNQFIIFFTTAPSSSIYSSNQPKFILANLNVNINQKAIPATQIYQKEPNVSVQHNKRTKICAFSLTNYVYQYSSTQDVAFVSLTDIGIYSVVNIDKIQIASPSQYSNIQFTFSLNINKQGYEIKFNSNPLIDDTIQLFVQCSIPFGITQTDTATVKISSTQPSSPYSIFIPYVGNSFSTYIDAGFIINVLNFPSIQDYQIQISFIPQFQTTQTIQCNSFTTLYNVIIPAYTIKYTTSVYLLIRVFDINGILRGKGYIQYINLAYQFLGQNSLTPISQSKLNPTANIQIAQDTSQFILSQAKYFNPQFYIQTWFCLDSNGNPCLDPQQKPLKLIQNGSNIVKISANSLPLNTQYTIYYQLMNQGFPFSKQYASYQIDSGNSYPYAIIQGIIPQGLQFVRVNLQDVVYVSIQLHTDFAYKISYAQYTLTLSYNNVQHTIQQVSNQFSFILQDYFPNPDFSQLVGVHLTYSIYDFYFQQNIPQLNSNPPSTIYVIPPPSPISLTIPNQAYTAFQDQVSITFNPTDKTKFYQFFYYESQADLLFEIQNPLQPKRKMLSTQSAVQQINCLLPAGNIVVMGVYFDPQYYTYANTTQTVQINNNNFNQQTIQTFVNNQMTQAQSYQNQNLYQNEIFAYQNILGSIEQFEAANTSPSQVNQVKIQILNRLMQSVWTQQFDDSYTLSGQIIQKLIVSQFQLDPQSQLFQQLQQSTVSRINQMHNAVQQKSVALSIAQINFFRENFQVVSNTYMELIKANSNQGFISNSDIENYTNQIMNGFTYLLQTNQSPIDFPTSQASFHIENNDNLVFFNNYYSQVVQNLDPYASTNFNYYVTVSSWSNSTYLYRDELIQYNQQYLSQANQTVQTLLNRTYGMKIPNVYTNNQPTPSNSRMRFLQSQSTSVPSGFTLNFGPVSQEEKLKCIQRQPTGNWVHNSCQTSIEMKNNQRIIKCVCQTPQVTSVISDITQLLDNKNLQKIFSEDGIAGLAQLTNWYEYAPIWTMIALNIGFAFMLFAAYGFDKVDKLAISQTTSLVYPMDHQHSNKNSQKKPKTLFLKVKIKKASEYNLQNEMQLETLQKQESGQEKLEVQQLLDEKAASNNTDSKEQNNQGQNKLKVKEEYSSQNFQTQLLINDKRNSSNQIEQNELQKLTQHQFKQGNKQDQQSQNNQVKKVQNDVLLTNIEVTDTNNLFDKEPSLKEQANQDKFYQNKSPQNKDRHSLKQQVSIYSQDGLSKEQNQQKNENLNEQKLQKKKSLADEDSLEKQIRKEDKEIDKIKQEEEKKFKDNLSRQKLIEYLNTEKPIYAIMTYHTLFQTFIIYQEDQSRLLRFIIYYNKVIWLLTLNSIFGKNISVVQVIVLSIVTTIVLQVVTTIIQILLKYKKLRIIGLFITFLFCLFCYYSILVVIAGQSAEDANIWIISYFAVFILNEFVIGFGICAAMYYACKKIILKAQTNTFLEFLGASPLLQAFSS
ncbi:transmembrane protein, putative (macronuclear) [Tetrahymena thermophila SB210]|uniref:Transmembrane protein, putative n=1 Tax=Tetrahymena thermophila (strain SB210) TaxID=312017 RepID=Q23J53_TETTS|nr:transmembrane protein, putative [Tetrahymena thermophila SB210]EAR96651.2 transmembrane protein, putative [Tetrahymena thermophila SB210]|eukprot:XP_001016896.2 transmembrane protein, putative [Tetrahymena thermophila SB210]